MPPENHTADPSRHGAQMRDNARKDALLRDASRQGATLRDEASYTLSVDEVVERLAAAGFPRSKRAVQRFCQMGHLECSRVATELGEKYFVTEESVVRRIKELEQLRALSGIPATGGDTVRHDAVASLRDASRQAAQGDDMAPPVAPLRDEARPIAADEELKALKSENEQLKKENLDLRIDNRGQEVALRLLSDQMVSERRTFMTQITDLTTKLLRLGSGSSSADAEPKVINYVPEETGDNSHSPKPPDTVQ